MSEFLGKRFTDKQIDDIVQYTNFKQMKQNHVTDMHELKGTISIATFYRKGMLMLRQVT